MTATRREQKLVDICFSCVLTVLDHYHVEKFVKMSTTERAEWVAKQLRGCGFNTKPVGASWGALVEDDEPKKISAIDQRRLRDADAALILPQPETQKQLLLQLNMVRDAIAALQSLDDLGSSEANALANSKMHVLQEKYDRLKVQLTWRT
jgi:hypothetical protein